MRYFIHVVTEKERIIDPEGAVFSDVAAARAEASQSARDLMADELRSGRPVPLGWRVQIADEEGAIKVTIGFASLMFGVHQGFGSEAKNCTADVMLIERTKATFARLRKSHSELNDQLVQLKRQLRTLVLFNAAIGPADTSS